MHENRIWNVRYYTVCINLLSNLGMEDSCWITIIIANDHFYEGMCLDKYQLLKPFFVAFQLF